MCSSEDFAAVADARCEDGRRTFWFRAKAPCAGGDPAPAPYTEPCGRFGVRLLVAVVGGPTALVLLLACGYLARVRRRYAKYMALEGPGQEPASGLLGISETLEAILSILEAEEAAVAPAPKGDEASPPAAAGEPEEGGPLSYKVSQGVLFIKRSKDRPPQQEDREGGAAAGRRRAQHWQDVDRAGRRPLGGGGPGEAGGARLGAARGRRLWDRGPGVGRRRAGAHHPAGLPAGQPRAAQRRRVRGPGVAGGLRGAGQVGAVRGKGAPARLLLRVQGELPAFAPNKSGQRLSADYMQEAKDHQTLSAMGFTPTRLATLLLVYTGDLPASLACRPAPLPRR
ncbi:unnamed protein product [Prorocentrum cordatum]|uniref:Uncharacterized protein n=1 Tax=Prorocentrum cordatum TaxID=2364126 RepID=A0ABN9TN94_9DINO|nr:unnamed protein product [Polarella glacialis]